MIKLYNEHEGQIPVGQMLSERNNTNAIVYWLSEWRRLGAKPQKEFICDFSVALISAACRTFTCSYDMNSYINVCWKIISKEDNVLLPQCYIRVDVAHVIKVVSRWKEIHASETRKKVRQFYLRSIGQLILSTHINEAKHILESICIVALSETEGHYRAKPAINTICEIRKEQLFSKFANGIQQSSIRNIIETEIDMIDDNFEVGESDYLEAY